MEALDGIHFGFMNDYPIREWFVAFLFTNASELPVYSLMLRRYFVTWWVPCLLTLVVNACTHPALWYLFPYFDPAIPDVDPYVSWAVIAESCVVLTEAFLIFVALSRFSRVPRPSQTRRIGVALLSSVLANLVSTVLGIVLLPAPPHVYGSQGIGFPLASHKLVLTNSSLIRLPVIAFNR
jgi:hypothetical protein